MPAGCVTAGAFAPAATEVKRIGLFGGSFDPVHNAHLALARQALGELALDELRWVPAGDAWQKTRRLTSPVHRVAMLQAALQGQAGFTIDGSELERSGPSYTLDTVRELQRKQPDATWWLLIGQDQHANLHTWHGFEELLQRVTLAVAGRPDAPLPADERVRAAPTAWVHLPPMAVSASDIRERVAAGKDITALVPSSVAQYIQQHRLYTGHTGS